MGFQRIPFAWGEVWGTPFTQTHNRVSHSWRLLSATLSHSAAVSQKGSLGRLAKVKCRPAQGAADALPPPAVDGKAHRAHVRAQQTASSKERIADFDLRALIPRAARRVIVRVRS